MGSVRLENQKQLKGKCITCLGCNRLEIADFERYRPMWQLYKGQEEW